MVSVHVLLQSLLLLCFICMPINGHIKLPINNNDDLILAKTAAHLVRKFFNQQTTTVVIFEKSLYNLSELRDFNNRIFDYILKNLNETITVQLAFERYFDYYSLQKCQGGHYVLIVDCKEAFLTLLRKFRFNFEGDFRVLVVLTYNTLYNYFETIQVIFETCKFYQIINVNILLNHDSLGVCMFSFNLFSEKECNVVQPYVHFRLIDGLDNLTEMFPQKVLNFHKCPLIICGQLNDPILTYLGNTSDPKSDDDQNWSNLRGIDGQLIKILSKSLNFTIELVLFPQNSLNYENLLAPDGCSTKLLNMQSDIAIGGYKPSIVHLHFTASVLYYHSPLVFIVRDKQEPDRGNRLGRPLSLAVWHSIIGLLLAGTVLVQTLRILKQSNRQHLIGQHNDTPLLNFLSISLGYSVTRDPKGNLARYLLILWLVITLIIRSAYLGSLYDSIRIDRFEKIPQKCEELLWRNYTFLPSKSYLHINYFTENNTIFRDSNTYDERLKMVASLDGKYATIALEDQVVHFLEKNYHNASDLRIIKEQVHLVSMGMYFRKHSIYAKVVNYHLNQLTYGGIVGQVVRNNVKDARLFRHFKVGVPWRAMTNDRIWSLYQITVLLMIVSMGVFILEVVSVYVVKVRIFLNWFQ